MGYNEKVTFTIPYPKSLKGYSLNDIYAGKHWTKRRKDSEFWHWVVIQSLKSQKIPCKLFGKPVRIVFNWCDRLDIDNHAYIGKMITDSLKGYLITDDTKKYYQELTHKFHEEEIIKVEVNEICNH